MPFRREGTCNDCGDCTEGCDVDAIRNGRIDINECHMCMKCVDNCPSKACSNEVL